MSAEPSCADESAPYPLETLRKSLEPLHALIADQDLFALGSSPHSSSSLFRPHMKVVSCNASARNAMILGLPAPVLTILDNEVLDPQVHLRKPGRSSIVAQGLLRNLSLGQLVSVQSNRSLGGDPALLEANWESHTRLTRSQRTLIVQRATGMAELDSTNWSMVSTGAFTIALGFLLGARSVVFSGFSLYQARGLQDPPHFYDSVAQDSAEESMARMRHVTTSRNHSMADAALVACLAVRGLEVDTEDPDFFALVRNWGDSRPPWAPRPTPPGLWR